MQRRSAIAMQVNFGGDGIVRCRTFRQRRLQSEKSYFSSYSMSLEMERSFVYLDSNANSASLM